MVSYSRTEACAQAFDTAEGTLASGHTKWGMESLRGGVYERPFSRKPLNISLPKGRKSTTESMVGCDTTIPTLGSVLYFLRLFGFCVKEDVVIKHGTAVIQADDGYLKTLKACGKIESMASCVLRYAAAGSTGTYATIILKRR